VLDDGFLWQSTHYGSLSAVARKITGTPWSGPLFFRHRAVRDRQMPAKWLVKATYTLRCER
jgi:hypothetical protein